MHRPAPALSAALFVAALSLTGCAAQAGGATAEASASPEPPANAEACATFSEVTVDVGNAVVADGLSVDIPAEYDRALLIAEGEVATRIQALVDNLPEPPHMIVWMDNRDAYNADIEAVARACAADDAAISGYATLVAG